MKNVILQLRRGIARRMLSSIHLQFVKNDQNGWPREFGTLNPNPHSEYSPRLFSYFGYVPNTCYIHIYIIFT